MKKRHCIQFKIDRFVQNRKTEKSYTKTSKNTLQGHTIVINCMQEEKINNKTKTKQLKLYTITK